MLKLLVLDENFDGRVAFSTALLFLCGAELFLVAVTNSTGKRNLQFSIIILCTKIRNRGKIRRIGRRVVSVGAWFGVLRPSF